MNNYYLDKLVKRAKHDMSARWRLGEILAEADAAGKKIVMDAKNKTINIYGGNNETKRSL